MEFSTRQFYSLLVLAYGLIVWGLILDFAKIQSPSWFLNYLGLAVELIGIALIGIAVYLRWPNTRSIMMAVILFSVACGLCYLEIAYLQPYFDLELIIGVLILVLAIPLIYGLYLWIQNRNEIFDIDVIEIRRKYYGKKEIRQ